VDAGAEAAVLGQPALGDVKPRDDLDAGDHRQVELPRTSSKVEEQAVDAVPDARAVVVRLDVDVGGAVESGPPEHVVDDPNHRRVVGLALQLPESMALSAWGRGDGPTLSPRSTLSASSRPSLATAAL